LVVLSFIIVRFSAGIFCPVVFFETSNLFDRRSFGNGWPKARSPTDLHVGERVRMYRVKAGIIEVGGADARGNDIQAAAAVFIEDCEISNSFKHGMYDRRTGGQGVRPIPSQLIAGS
jgi:hypothetical protein